MPKGTARPRRFQRGGPDLTAQDGRPPEHHTTPEAVGQEATRDDGAFALGYCQSCDWTGPARRARAKARRDAIAHQGECPSKGEVHVGLSENDPR